MSPRRVLSPRVIRRSATELAEPLLVKPRLSKGREPLTVAFQWYDGAGELHYEILTPAQSWPYLRKI
ncbi:MAG: hypothetical protein JNL43_04865 [Flavobacteriales bacterium]|nr:hypothetical protein [Flavobacteriales bacterium]HRH68651.1 hypothetical protein [Flavobacteriales bacterium]